MIIIIKLGGGTINNQDFYKKWFPFETGLKEKNKITLYCFHHAGGSASVFRRWISKKNDINIISVELPGKGTRMDEQFIEDMDLLADQLADAIIFKSQDSQFCFFGHSMGAVIAFKVAYRLKIRYNVEPIKLIVAGRHAPYEPNPDEFKSYMDDDALIKEMKKINATSKQILENKELMEFLLPIIRNDYRLHESFKYQGEVLSIPIIAHAGKNDIDANKEVMEKWRTMTSKDFTLREFEGKHFFIYDLGEEYINELIKDIA
ncbi:thioesterase domain-containing protein [Clostridiaceae bacterium M8S5]|nr:thioesterase domain-containing protein [Clostridiaceae bacterium M8S5]